jgi:hypothetical protein
MSAVPKKIRDEVFFRDRDECVVSRSPWAAVWPCAGALTLQHRRGRGMGGAKNAHDVWNLCVMCAVHNQLETSDAVFHQVCVDHGWSVPRWSGIPSAKVVPLWAGGCWWFLTDTGRQEVSLVEVEARMRELYGVVDSHRSPTHW